MYEEIVKLIKERDEQGMVLLLRHFKALIRYVAEPVLGSPEDIEDCLQETAHKVWKKIESFDPSKGSFKSWVTAIARNTALNMKRGIKEHDSYDEIPEEMPSDTKGTEQTAVENDAAAAVRKAVEQLPEKDRLLIYRRFYYMQSISQIAAETGLGERAVEGRIYRIKQKLAVMLGDYKNE